MPGTLASFDDGYYYPEVPVTCDICGSPSVKRVELERKTVTMREAERDIKVDKAQAGTGPTYDHGCVMYDDSTYVERVKPATRDRPPAVVLNQMAQVMSDLAVHGSEYQNALTRQASAKVAFEREKARALVSLVDEYKRAGDRLPAEDVRNALTLEKLEEFYVPLLAADADVVGLKAVLDVEKSLLMGLQSELRVLREEMA